MVLASKLASERMQLDLLIITVSRAPQGEHVRDYTPLRPSHNLKVLCTTVKVLTSAITCARASRPGTLNSNPCTIHAVGTFLRQQCYAYFISFMGRPPPGLNYQCRKAKHDIPRFYQGPTKPREVYGTMLSETHDPFQSSWLVHTPAPPFPAGYSTAGLYARPNSAEASGQLSPLEHVLHPPGALVGWRP